MSHDSWSPRNMFSHLELKTDKSICIFHTTHFCAKVTLNFIPCAPCKSTALRLSVDLPLEVPAAGLVTAVITLAIRAGDCGGVQLGAKPSTIK